MGGWVGVIPTSTVSDCASLCCSVPRETFYRQQQQQEATFVSELNPLSTASVGGGGGGIRVGGTARAQRGSGWGRSPDTSLPHPDRGHPKPLATR